MAFVLLLGSAVIGLVLIELVARLLFPDMTYRSLVLRLTNERPTWARPDAEFHHVGDGIYHLNFPDADGRSTNRVMIVGDSFAMGHQVGEEKRFGHLLQQHLAEGAKVDVLASTSYSPIIYRNIIRKAFSLAPYRAVAVFVDQTDPADELIYEEDVVGDGTHTFDVDRMSDRRGAIDAAYVDLLKAMSATLSIRHAAIYNVLRPPSLAAYFKPGDKYYHYVKLSLARLELIREFAAKPDSDESRNMAGLMMKHLDDIVALCREQQVPLFLFANPWEFQTSARPRITVGLTGPFPKENRPEMMMESRYGALPGVHVVPMTHAFREQANPSSLYIDNPGHEFHWNEAGHVLAEEVLLRQLTAELPDLKASP